MSDGKITGIVQAAFAVTDMARAVAFYRDTVGLPLTFTTAGMTFFDAGGVRLLLGPPQPDQSPGGDAVLYFGAEDFTAAEACLSARGVTFMRDAQVIQREGAREHCLRFFADPDGHTLGLMGWR